MLEQRTQRLRGCKLPGIKTVSTKYTERSRQEARGVQAWGVVKREGPGENT